MSNENIKKEFEELKNAYKDMFDNISIEQFKQIKEKVENERKITAKEMFEKLGYEHFDNGRRITYQNYKISECKFIEFNLEEKKMWLADDSEEVVILSLKEIKAINKQIEELGWNNE